MRITPALVEPSCHSRAMEIPVCVIARQ